MTTEKTIAEKMADRMGNDGSSISEMDIEELDCAGVCTHFEGRNRWEFPEDLSAICEIDGNWDVEKPGEPYSWRGGSQSYWEG